MGRIVLAFSVAFLAFYPKNKERKIRVISDYRYRIALPEEVMFGHGEVRVYRGTGVSRGVRRTTWDRSLKIWKLQIPCFEEFFW